MRIGTLIKRELNMEHNALRAATSRGQISIDGRTLAIKDLNDPAELYRGQIVKLWRREHRILGGRIVDDHEQMMLG